ncbi:WhiB family transcriptional regulator [Streptomyces pactum]|uniref:WhiB family transcriptional regulator n=1 Tax=Streptomyces pactum TaxID=68249 RepID=A0ABS0NLR2_9ACTN|nr:WhiB family transcriptional regulator [Streptomyces pactum]
MSQFRCMTSRLSIRGIPWPAMLCRVIRPCPKVHLDTRSQRGLGVMLAVRRPMLFGAGEEDAITLPCQRRPDLFQHPVMDTSPSAMNSSAAEWRTYVSLVGEARTLCASCPLWAECLRDAVVFADPYGYAAATTPADRRWMRRRLGVGEPDGSLNVTPSDRLSPNEVVRQRRRFPEPSQREMAAELGCSRSTVARRLASERAKAAGGAHGEKSSRPEPDMNAILDAFDALQEQLARDGGMTVGIGGALGARQPKPQNCGRPVRPLRPSLGQPAPRPGRPGRAAGRGAGRDHLGVPQRPRPRGQEGRALAAAGRGGATAGAGREAGGDAGRGPRQHRDARGPGTPRHRAPHAAVHAAGERGTPRGAGHQGHGLGGLGDDRPGRRPPPGAAAAAAGHPRRGAQEHRDCHGHAHGSAGARDHDRRRRGDPGRAERPGGPAVPGRRGPRPSHRHGRRGPGRPPGTGARDRCADQHPAGRRGGADLRRGTLRRQGRAAGAGGAARLLAAALPGPGQVGEQRAVQHGPGRDVDPGQPGHLRPPPEPGCRNDSSAGGADP